VVAFSAQLKLVKLSRANGSSSSLSYYKVIVEEGYKDLRRNPIWVSRMVVGTGGIRGRKLEIDFS